MYSRVVHTAFLAVLLCGISTISPAYKIVIPPIQNEAAPPTAAAVAETEVLDQAASLAAAGKLDDAIAALSKEADRLNGASENRKARALVCLELAKLQRKEETSPKEMSAIHAAASLGSVGRSPIFADESVIAEAEIEMGWVYRDLGNLDTSLEHFLYVAEGKVPSTTLQATNAAIRAGFMCTKLMKKNDDAIDIWTQTADKTPMKDDGDFARLQATGALWESGKGIYDQNVSFVRRKHYFEASIKSAEKLINDPKTREEIRCVAELLRTEDYYFLGNYPKAEELASAFIVKWSEARGRQQEKVSGKTWSLEKFPSRQLITCWGWLIGSQYLNGHYEACLASVEKLKAEGFSEEDQYGNFNVYCYAETYRYLSLQMMGKEAEAKEVMEAGRAKWPAAFDSNLLWVAQNQ